MMGVSKFCKQPFVCAVTVCTIAPFFLGGGVKSGSVMLYSMPQTVANLNLIQLN